MSGNPAAAPRKRNLWGVEESYSPEQFYCLAPETRVLRGDMRWVRADQIQEEDEIVGVDEFPVAPAKDRKFRKGQVVAVRRRVTERVRVTLEDGRSVTTSADHRWLSRPGSAGNLAWIVSSKLEPGKHELKVPFDPWDDPSSLDDAWLSGVIDGEGSWNSRGLSITQKPGLVADRIQTLLDEMGVEYTIQKHSTGVLNFYFCNLREGWKVLGRTRPVRFIDDERWIGTSAKSTRKPYSQLVVAVERIGRGPVVSIETTHSTLIAEGVIGHNCKATDDRGHSAYTRLVRVPPSVVEQIESLIATKEIPAYRSVADFFRDAIIHRLAYIREHLTDPKFREKMSEVLRLVHLEEVTQRMDDEFSWFESFRDKISSVSERALQLGDDENLREFLGRMVEDVEPLREPFRSQLLSLIDLYKSKLDGKLNL